MLAHALQLQAFGPAETSLHLVTLKLPDPKEGEVLVRMEASPIHPADLLLIAGKYGISPKLPTIIGNEGVGRVIQCGKGITSLQHGDLVVPGTLGMWTEARIVKPEECVLLPPTLDILQAAQLTVAPLTAYWLLASFKTLAPGTWIVQNAANSAVGRSVIQIARCLDLKTLNVVRRPELAKELQALGADVVLTEGQLTVGATKLATPPLLALDAVGGTSALDLANALAPGGIQITYGAVSRQPLTIPTGLLIYKNLTFKGFWRTAHWTSLSAEDRQAAINRLSQWMMNGVLQLPVEKTYALKDFSAAIFHTRQSHRAGKILFRF